MLISDKIVDSVTELDRVSFERLREKWFRPHYDQTGLDLLRQRATSEQILTQYYRGRAPYELLQNADDVGATEAVFILLPEGLVFAHNGAWFSARNFKSLADGWSDKDPNQCIGHKGLGIPLCPRDDTLTAHCAALSRRLLRHTFQPNTEPSSH